MVILGAIDRSEGGVRGCWGLPRSPSAISFKFGDPLALRAGASSMQIHAASNVGVFIEMVVSGHALGREASSPWVDLVAGPPAVLWFAR